MNNFLIGAAVAAPLILGSLPVCAGTMPMTGPMQAPVATAYKFELVGSPRTANGKSTVSIRLIHNNNPVANAIIIRSRADMGPIGMAAMTASIKSMPSTTPGIYTFEVANGAVWQKPDKWALTFDAKVQGEAKTVHGVVVVQLSPEPLVCENGLRDLALSVAPRRRSGLE